MNKCTSPACVRYSSCFFPQTCPDNPLVERLRKRAEIRRSIPRGEPDRISDLLEEAAARIVELEEEKEINEGLMGDT